MSARSMSRARRTETYRRGPDGITTVATHIYDRLAARLSAQTRGRLAWRDMVDNVWDM